MKTNIANRTRAVSGRIRNGGVDRRLNRKGGRLPGVGIVCLALTVTPVFAETADARIDSWHTAESSQYARVRETDAAASEGATTWTGQTLPAYAGVQELAYDSDYVYVRSYGLAGYVMGPWYLNAARTQLFPNRPLAAVRIRRISRNPAPAATRTLTGLGAIGMYVNGVSLFDNRDGFAWNGSAESGNGQGYWQRDAWVNEGVTFDQGFAHQEQSGNYHYHAHPPALRYQLGDNVSYNALTGIYAENTNSFRHSPILAWVADGFPIYGPYGYSNPTNPASGVRRMLSGFVLRNGQKGADNLTATGRSAIPAWAQRAYNVGAAQSGPAINTTYPLGRYLEDNAYLGDLTNPLTGQLHQAGKDFDLNEYNCRWCVTPEFPSGTWAYFCTLTESNTPAFPYAVGRQYFGTPDSAAVTAIPATATTVFKGGPDSRESLAAPWKVGTNIVLAWSAIEGGSYQVETATSLASSNFTTVLTNVAAAGVVAQVTVTNGATADRRFFRVARTGLAPYYGGTTTGTTNGTGQTITASPSAATRGTVNLSVTFSLSATATPALPPANVMPSSVLIGSTAGTSIARPNSPTVTALFSIPGNAATNGQTVTITFPGPGGAAGPSYTQVNGFTVNP